MTARVDFYLLGSDDRSRVLLSASRIAEKAYLQGMQVYIQVDRVEEEKELDQLLWQLGPASFVPHGVEGSSDVETPVLIGPGCRSRNPW